MSEQDNFYLHKMLERIRKAIGAEKTRSIEKDPYLAASALEAESDEILKEVRDAAEEGKKFFRPWSKFWVGASIVVLCAAVIIGRRQIQRHFQEKERKSDFD